LELKVSKKTVIFDLDGTLADIEIRRKMSVKSNYKMDWDMFFHPDNIKYDKPVHAIINLAQIYYKDGYNVVIFSGRNDRSWKETKDWLKKYDVPHHLLVMRPDKFKSKSFPVADGNPATGDMRFMPDEILKKKMLDEFADIDDVLFVVDDRQKVVDMWRDLGLVVLQPAPGNF
tara:strand:- start:916 stop:1434 length:519 start_codon:yes stop_codon:yes gene_type:complete